MGTHSVTYLIVDGRTRLASATGMDGYPRCEGLNLLGFCSRKKNLEILVDSLDRCTMLDESFYREQFEKNGYGWEEKYIEAHPNYIYMGGAEALRRIVKSTGMVMVYNLFGDRKLDDWCYVIDMDRNTFEVYKGFNKTPLTSDERFYDPNGPDDGGYYPFKEVAIFDLDNLPDDKTFMDSCKRP